MRRLTNLVAWSALTACSTEAIVIASREASSTHDGDTDEAPNPAPNDDAQVESDAGATTDAAPVEDGCKTNEECGDGRYCQKDLRDATYGRCEPRPIACAANQAPVCGSDFISYFNDCVRKQHGISFAEPGQCLKGAVRCGSLLSVGECPPDTFCARLIPRSPTDIPLLCDFDILATEGSCWGMPEECDPLSAGRGRWVLCPSVITGSTFGGGGPGGGPAGAPSGGTFGGGGTGGGNFGGGMTPPCVDTCSAIKSESVHVTNTLACGR